MSFLQYLVDSIRSKEELRDIDKRFYIFPKIDIKFIPFDETNEVVDHRFKLALSDDRKLG